MKIKTNKTTLITNCSICNGATTKLKDNQLKVDYLVCQNCGFIYKDKKFRIDVEEEAKNYSLHNNSFECEGYVKIFIDLIKEYITPLKIKGNILEFGSGPGPVLKELLQRDYNSVYDYDPFFNNDKSYLKRKYELITSTEVVEHFFNPLKEFEHLSNLLLQGGYLLITTRLRTMDLDNFLDWWYRRDITHVSFYTIKSLEIIAAKFNLKILKTNNINIVLFQKI